MKVTEYAEQTQCSKCHKPAIIKQEYSGNIFCHSHLIADVEAKVKREIRNRSWLSPHDSIAVALSGGVGSIVCLLLLHKLFARRRDITLCAIYIYEGIDSFRDPKDVISIAEQIGVPCITRTFKEAYGMTVDQYAAHQENICVWCDTKRQLLIDLVAQEHNITKIAYGYHLEDFSSAVVTGIVKGDPSSLLYGDTRIDAKHIAPLCLVPKKEVLLYSDITTMIQCPYTKQSVNNGITEILDQYAKRHPSVHHAIVGLSHRISSKHIQKA
jgi:tRNA(Ile)-lysidine synthase TilS/MesJ